MERGLRAPDGCESFCQGLAVLMGIVFVCYWVVGVMGEIFVCSGFSGGF